MSSVYSLLYLGVVMVGLLAYARHYTTAKKRALFNATQIYEHNFAKDIYEELSADQTRNVKLEKAALMAWAAEDLARSFKMHETKNPLNALSQAGLVGEDLVKRFAGSEVLMRQQVQQVVGTAQKMQDGWAQTIMGTAQEVAQNNALRKRLDQMSLFEKEFEAMTAKA